MSIRYVLVATALSASVVFAQEPRSGVSHPDSDPLVTTQDVSAQSATESASTPKRPAASETKVESYGPYVPYQGAASKSSAQVAAQPQNVDGEIVSAVEEHAGELREGTLLRARLLQALSTQTTEVGSDFTASLTEPVEKDGRVVLPAGALLHGRITAMHSGHRISGPAMLHLEAKSVDLPDGTRFPVRAMLIDTDQTGQTKIDREGSVVRRDHPKETLAAMGLAVGGATTAGAMLGGGVGALVGAGVSAGAGTVVWLRQDRQASLPVDAVLVFSLSSAMPTVPQSSASNSMPVSSSDGQVVGDSDPGLR